MQVQGGKQDDKTARFGSFGDNPCGGGGFGRYRNPLCPRRAGFTPDPGSDVDDERERLRSGDLQRQKDPLYRRKVHTAAREPGGARR